MFNLFIVLSLLVVCSGKSLFKQELNVLEETQHAVCNISSKDLQATANASITRQLVGVCSSIELNQLILELREDLMKELAAIKNYLTGFGDKKKSYQKDNINFKSLRTRNEEIEFFNNTVKTTENNGDLFCYYWKLKGITSLLSKQSIYIYSPSFVILGHKVQLQFYPHHLGTDFIGIQLRPDSTSFIKQHKIAILDQINENNDLKSSILGDIFKENMFKVAYKMLQTGNLISEDALLIKLELYVNS